MSTPTVKTRKLDGASGTGASGMTGSSDDGMRSRLSENSILDMLDDLEDRDHKRLSDGPMQSLPDDLCFATIVAPASVKTPLPPVPSFNETRTAKDSSSKEQLHTPIEKHLEQPSSRNTDAKALAQFLSPSENLSPLNQTTLSEILTAF